MFTDLGILIELIQENYNKISLQWEELHTENVLNLKRKQVKHIREDAEILNEIWNYRTLLNKETLMLTFALYSFEFPNSVVTSRVKAQNSIEYKIENYIRTHEGGNIPIKKCINDLFGIRIVIDEEFSFENVKEYVKNNYPQYKCIDSSKSEYRATHIYFEKNNYSFPWELQVWSSFDEEKNYESHRKYKQEYTNWENNEKGGE